MLGMNEKLPPVIAPPPETGWGRGAVLLLILVGAAIVEIPAYLLWNRTARAERELASLSQRTQELQRQVVVVRSQADTAAVQASQAQESAAQAAHQRDQAEQAQAQSAQAAEQAQHQAALANQQANQAQQQAIQARQEAENLRAERQAQLDRLQAVLSKIASTRRTASGLVVSLDSNAIRFDFDKSTIRPGNRETLSRMAGVLMTLQGYQISVYGYTDDIGTTQYNQKLSERRAEAVRDYLVNAGVDPTMITSTGYGESDPLQKGDSAQARAKNRRVEIGITDSVLRMVGVVPPTGRSR